MKRFCVPFVALCAVASACATALAQTAPHTTAGAAFRMAARFDRSGPLREVAPLKPGRPSRREEPARIPGGAAESGGTATDAALQSSPGLGAALTAGLNFEGIGDGFSGPSGNFTINNTVADTNGDVGLTQYVQWVNFSFAVFDKVTGAVQYGPAAGNTLWSGFGGPCETRNDGDPVVQYDQMAHRWVMTQLALGGGNYQCVAVSQTSDATGAYYRYAFGPFNNELNDYPKLTVWPDAYYVSFNMFNEARTTSLGSKVCAYDRAQMLAGLPAAEQCFQLSSSYAALLPADLEGATLPPAGTPNFFLNLGGGQLRLWKFAVNWSQPASTTLTGPIGIPVASFSRPCVACVPQPGTSQALATLGDRLMYRLAYRNFGTHQSLTVNHTVKAGGNTGIRWYEIRNPGGTPVVYQQGTYAPDSSYRWMGSMAMDKVGNIAVGYSISSRSVRPGIRFAARAPSDAPGTLGAETVIQAGTGSQTGNSWWGDYSSMSLDPSDDCTMWYTTHYQTADGLFNWHTRIASFKMQGCQ
jgi:hypothetical protein